MNGVLKFLNTSPEAKTSPGKKCFPQKSIGVSQEAPLQFQLRNTLIDTGGYIWTQPVTEPLLSHLRYVSVVGSGHMRDSFKEEHEKRYSKDKSSFRKKKGLLAEFMDKHGWQNKVTKLMGFQRSDETRELKNNDISKVKLRAKEKTERKSRSTYHRSFDQSEYSKTSPACIDEKNRVRKKRQQIYEQEAALLSGQRKFKRKVCPSSIDRFISNKGDNVSFLRLCCPEDHTDRPSSLTYRTMDSLFCNTARTQFDSRAKFRQAFEIQKQKQLGTGAWQFDGKELQEFQGRFLKNGVFRANRSGYKAKGKNK